MSEIIWNEHIVEGTLNGEKVRFKCKYWSKDIYVEMIEPYQGENESLHIMYMVPHKYDETNWASRAWGLVKKIFERKNWESKNSEFIHLMCGKRSGGNGSQWAAVVSKKVI